MRLTRIWRTRWRSRTTSSGAPGVFPVEADALLRGDRAVLRDDGLDELPRVEGLRLDGQFAGLDLGQVEDLIDQSEQVLPAALDPSERRPLLFVERAIDARQERVGEAEDGVQGSPQLVAHARQEAGLRLAGLGEGHVGGSESRGQLAFFLEERLEAFARVVQVPRELAELVAIGDFDPLREITCGDRGQRAFHLADGKDESPREHEPEHQRDDHARGGEHDHDRGQEPAIRREGGLGRRHLLTGRRDGRGHLTFQDV